MRTPIRRVIGMVCIGLAVVSSLAWEFAASVRTSGHLGRLGEQYERNLTTFNCLTRETERLLPRHATVDVGPMSEQAQLLSELTVGWATVSPRDRATWALSLRRPGSCGGIGIKAVRR